MASELKWRHDITGLTLYATIRSEAGQMWNTAGTPALEALTVANWADYDIALAETPASSYFYAGDWPAGLTTVGNYWVDVYEQAGASPAIGDELVASLFGYWDGTTLKLTITKDLCEVTEAYPASGDTPTLGQLLWLTHAGVLKQDLDGTTLRLRNTAGAIVATYTITLNSQGYPVVSTRAS